MKTKKRISEVEYGSIAEARDFPTPLIAFVKEDGTVGLGVERQFLGVDPGFSSCTVMRTEIVPIPYALVEIPQGDRRRRGRGGGVLWPGR